MAQVTTLQIESAIEEAVRLDNLAYLYQGYTNEAVATRRRSQRAWVALDELVEEATVATLRAVDDKYQNHVREALHRAWNKEVA